MAAGPHHTVAIKNDGTLWAWGRNYYGQLGNGSSALEETPIEINCSTSSTNNSTFSSSDLKITPNPAQNDIFISVPDILTQGLTYEVRNILGAVIISRQSLMSNIQRININALAQGVYIISVGNREGQISRQFVKI